MNLTAPITDPARVPTPASPLAALLPFAPFVAFALIEKLFGAVAGLSAGALVSMTLLAFARLNGEKQPNLLEAGSALVFAGLAVLAVTGDAAFWSVWPVRLGVDAGLLLIVLLSIAVRRPFTLQQARRRVSPQVAGSAAFLRANDVLSGVWALAFAGLVLVDAWMVARPQTPVSIAVGLTAIALAAATGFTTVYAKRLQARRLGQAAGSAL